MPLFLEVITPDSVSLSLSVDSVTLPTATGVLTILPGHQPILGQVATGEMLYKAKGETQSFAVDAGFYTLQGDKLSLLVEGAVSTAAIDLQQIEDAQKRAEAALENAKKQKLDPAEVEEFERIVRFTLAQKLVKASRH